MKSNHKYSKKRMYYYSEIVLYLQKLDTSSRQLVGVVFLFLLKTPFFSKIYQTPNCVTSANTMGTLELGWSFMVVMNGDGRTGLYTLRWPVFGYRLSPGRAVTLSEAALFHWRQDPVWSQLRHISHLQSQKLGGWVARSWCTLHGSP